jgi:UDP-N-acetylmuramate--alanine ligase
MIGLRARQQNGHGSGGAGAIPHRVHLVGAGGVHLSAIGQVLLNRGHAVTGSDLAASDFTRRLEALGARIYIGPHEAAHLDDAELVVTTVAAKPDNPELVAARARGVPVMVRAEMVEALIADRDVLAIAGTHGKTTTTSLVALMAIRGELDPLVLLGGDSRELGGNVRDGAGRHAIVEADEYAEAFLQYTPQTAVILNVEPDHLDYYGSEERLEAAFRAFAARVVPGGLLLVCEDSPVAAQIGAERRAAGVHVERYAIDQADVEWRATKLRRNERGGTNFDVLLSGTALGRIALRVPGRHNVANALAALAVAMRAGVDFHRAAAAAEEFTGASRRFDVIGEVAREGGPITVVDDYAHHPTEVRVNVGAARQRYPNRRLVACFQPHTYSRTQYLLEGFRHCFEGLDALYLVPTYAARETPDQGMDGRALAAEIAKPRPVYLESFEAAADRIAHDLRPGDVFITFGAGTITELGPMVLARLEAEAAR